MAQIDLHTSTARMQTAAKDLMAAWQAVAEDWDDEISRKFCAGHLEPLGPPIKLSLDALRHMTQLIDQMQRECEE